DPSASLAARLHAIASAVASNGATSSGDVMSCLVECLPGPDAPRGATIAARLWPKLTEDRPDERRIKLLDASLSVTCDHGLTYSALGARLCAAIGGSVADAVASALPTGIASVRASRFTALADAVTIALEDGTMRAIDSLDREA